MNSFLLKALSVFPEDLRCVAQRAAEVSPAITEIRLVADRSFYFYTASGVRFITKGGGISILPCDDSVKPTFAQLENICNRAIGFSGFSHERELNEGFVTYGGACRMGICTSDNDKSMGHGRITSLAIRIPFDGNPCYPAAVDDAIREMKSGILIAGAPSSGKTTLLKYIARRLSSGITGEIKKVTVIDERYELSGGCSLGETTDVISGKNKKAAIVHAVRTLSPHYVICDEIGSSEEASALLDGLNSGIKFVASIHADNIEGLKNKQQFRLLYNENVFDCIILLSSLVPGHIQRIYKEGDMNSEIHRLDGILPVA